MMRIARASSIHRIAAAHFHDNPASGAVLRKLGFRKTGRVEKRRSAGREQAADCVLFEDADLVPARQDPAMELYHDRSPIAA